MTPLSIQDLHVIDEEQRKAWLEERRRGIGASESSALLGINPWASPMSVYASKLVGDSGKPPSEAALWGTLLERTILEEYGRRNGRKVEPHDQTVSLDHPRFAQTRMTCTPDGFDVTDPSRPELDEVKNIGLRMADQWRVGPPLYYQVQVQHQMAVTGLDRAVIVALIGGQELRSYEVPRNDRFIAHLERICARFWIDHVEPKEPPEVDELPATAEAIELLHPMDNGETIELVGVEDIDERYREVESEIKALEKEKSLIKNTIKSEMGSATFGIIEGVSRWSWKHQTRGSSTFRVLKRGRFK